MFKFDSEIALESILYIANRVPDPTFHKISKIFYFADKAHLEKYGRFICGDSYIAMRHGPVPSGIYDILKAVRGDGLLCIDTTDAFTVMGEYTVVPLRKENGEVFSDSDIECLDASINQYGRLSFGQLTKLSHIGAWERAGVNDIIELRHIAADFANPTELMAHLQDQHPG